ncbi:hypothetical protein AA0113_g6323 [Alternaria arborescens]|uniref:Uncharacterized protein n=3 Tax=Alternaria sect. Alternaria TaxID=2499237 RepID=A0A4Q4NU79_ALTAL|nr:hypothetical protein AA0111_g8114 [Alternaria arborescens]RYN38247.1 hypothetical protein AA0115_g440 [Alternaria tenuissima]RYN83767.1 hypothetical protein AA0117_g347 [Alternaria alternata]RYN28452.1 hypothetical protein AA0112_g7608 [Alternaria arborescens]RYN51776.1 hypothetical protein AA0114_g5234 [Alternaria tenuissima]RYN63845.1 hypothetical protein AA0118_g4565 [Alternaria tenuissima]
MQLKADTHTQKVEGYNQPQDVVSGPWSNTSNQELTSPRHATTQFYSISASETRKLRSDGSSPIVVKA